MWILYPKIRIFPTKPQTKWQRSTWFACWNDPFVNLVALFRQLFIWMLHHAFAKSAAEFIFSLARFCLCPILSLLPFVRLILILILILMTESAVKFMIWSVKFCTMTSYKISFYFCIAEAVVKEIRSDMNSCFTKLVTDLQICISKFVIHSV